MKLEFRLLGEVAVLADGQPLELGGTRQRSVFALLMLQRNRPLATDFLVDRLWPDEPPLTATKTIQVYISRIRQLLGADSDRLTSSSTGYQLAVADDELDAARFERGLRGARETRAAVSSEASIGAFEEALAQWSGPALGDLAAEQFARREAGRLEELRVQALEELSELRIDAGLGRETIGELRQLLEGEPGRERLWRLLMLALYADGRQAEALQAYQDARRYLADELGLDPSPELRDLERGILTQEAPRPWPGETVQTVLSSSPATENIGHPTRRVVTVLRADFVPSRDDDLDPEVLDAVERRGLEIVRRSVERHGGTILQATHEGVSTVFGLTVAREDDALRAVRAAVELKGEEPRPEVANGVVLRVGVATGEVLTGGRDRSGSTVTGAPVQAATRLAAQAAPREVLLTSETEELVRALASTEPAQFGKIAGAPGPTAVRLVNVADGEAITRRTGTRFVGRKTEMSALIAAFERVVSEGTPGLASITGIPGIGKSRLVAESFARISERAVILRSRCLPYGDGITYWPIQELVLAASGSGAGETGDDTLAKLKTIVEGLDRSDLVLDRIASVVGLSEDPVSSEEIPWSVRHFFQALAGERPLVLLVDDLQWAEPALVDLLGHVLDLGRGPIFLITVARPELEDVHPDWLLRPSLLQLRLDSLGESDSEDLLDHLAPELPHGRLRSRVLATAEGNPLFVEQFVAYVSDEANVDERRLTDRTAPELPVPPTIGALLAARLDRLPDVERRTLERAAVVGRTFWAGAVAELLPDDLRAELTGRLAQLARRDLIRPDRSRFADDEAYRFRHLLIRDAAYAALPKAERAALHVSFADWLVARSAGDPGEYELIVGYHLEQAYRYHTELGDDPAAARLLADRALALIAPAGQAAHERGDPHAAIALLRRAIDLAPQGTRRIELLLDLRDDLHIVGERGAFDSADAEALVLLAKYPDEGLEYRRWLADEWFAAPDGPGTIAEAEAAYAYFEGVDDAMGMIRALELAMALNHNQGRFTASLELLDQAMALAFEIGRPDRAGTLFTSSAFSLPSGPIPVPDALVRLRRYMESAGSNRSAHCMFLMCLGQLEAMTGDGDQWRRHFEAAKAIIDDIGLLEPFETLMYPEFLGQAEVDNGEPGRVVGLLQESCSTMDRLYPSTLVLASLAPLTALALLAAGRLDEVEHYAFWGRDLALPNDMDGQVRWRLAVSGLRSAQGKHDEAVDLARAAVACTVGSEWVVHRQQSEFRLAAALRSSGDLAGALDAASEARRFAAAKQDQAALRRIEAFIASKG